MPADGSTALVTCALGHWLVGGRCVACEKARRSASRAIPEVPVSRFDKLRAKNRRDRAKKAGACPLHVGETGDCPRCKVAHAANAKALRETTPFWRAMKQRELHAQATADNDKSEVNFRHSRMFATLVTWDEVEDGR